MRSSKEQWTNQMQNYDSSRTIEANFQMSGQMPQQRKLQNFRKSSYNQQQTKPNEGQKSYRGPVLKNGLQINAKMPAQGQLMGSLPNSTKNQIVTVQNKFQNRDVSPNKMMGNTISQNSFNGNSNMANGHQAQRGFQQQLPPGHNGRVQSLDVNN